jgi:hypothetical protein
MTSSGRKRPYRELIYLGKRHARIYPYDPGDQVFLIRGSIQLRCGRERQALTAKAFTHGAMHLADTRARIMLEQL